MNLYYHDACQDGLTAAGLLLDAQRRDHYIKDLGLTPVPYRHGEQAEYEPGSIWVDCLPPEGLSAHLVLDHHPAARNHSLGALHYCPQLSGAGMVWRFLYGLDPMPWWIQAIQEYDLSGGQGPAHEDVCAFVTGYLVFLDNDPYRVSTLLTDKKLANEVLETGRLLYKDRKATFGQAPRLRFPSCASAPRSPEIEVIFGARGWTQFLKAGPGHLTLLCYGEGQVSARGDGARALAKFFGGDGHEQAAGFRCSIPELLERLSEGDHLEAFQ